LCISPIIRILFYFITLHVSAILSHHQGQCSAPVVGEVYPKHVV
jgi:hypothetical protein